MVKSIKYNITSFNNKNKFYYRITYLKDGIHYKKYCYNSNNKLIYTFTFDENDNIIDAKMYPHIFYSINNQKLSKRDAMKINTKWNKITRLTKQRNGLLKAKNHKYIIYNKIINYNEDNLEYLKLNTYFKIKNKYIKEYSIVYFNNEIFSIEFYDKNRNNQINYY